MSFGPGTNVISIVKPNNTPLLVKRSNATICNQLKFFIFLRKRFLFSESFTCYIIILQFTYLPHPELMGKISKFLKKWAIPGLFFVYFRSFSQNINTILQQINLKKCPSSIEHWDSNTRPSECESPPISTRQGLPPYSVNFTLCNFFSILIG